MTHPTPTVSKLRIYSLGIVAANKQLNSNDIEVTPIEDLPMVNGALTDNASTYSSSATDAKGSTYQTQTQTSSTVHATWLPLGDSNRQTAPDVRRGEQVMIYQFGDADKYYWNTMKNDLKFRRLETVVYAFSGTANESDPVDNTTCYFVEFSTHKGSITLHTSKANKEPYAYDIILDTKNGNIRMQDDIGNFFLFDSTQNQFHMENADGSIFDMMKQAMSLTTVDSISLQTKTYSLKCTDNNVESTNSTMKTQTNSLTAVTNKIDAATLHAGPINTTTGTQGLGTAKMSGDVDVDGTIHATGDITSDTNMQAPTGNFPNGVFAPNNLQ